MGFLFGSGNRRGEENFGRGNAVADGDLAQQLSVRRVDAGGEDQKPGLAGESEIDSGKKARGAVFPLDTSRVFAAKDSAAEDNDGVSLWGGGRGKRRIGAFEGAQQKHADCRHREEIQDRDGDDGEQATAEDYGDESEKSGEADGQQKGFHQLAEEEEHFVY